MKKEEKRALFLPAELYGRIEERVRATGFSSVDEYVVFVLEQVLNEEEGEEEEGALSKEDEEEAKKRLRALGYLD